MSALVAAIIMGSLAYLVWSLRRFFTSVRAFLHFTTGEGTVTSRLMPNLAFAALVLMLINQTFMFDAFLLGGFTGGTSVVQSISGLSTKLNGPFIGIAEIGTSPQRGEGPMAAIMMHGEF